MSASDEKPPQHNEKSDNDNTDSADNTKNTDNIDKSVNNSDDGLSDEEVNQALAGYEQDFAGMRDSFDDQLQGILGNKAQRALIVTTLGDPKLFAAFCVMADVDASCVGASSGAIAVLTNCEGREPEQAAKRLTTLISSLSIVLIVNRADKLEAHSWLNGQEGEKIAPPLIFMHIDEVAEDLVISQASLDTLAEDGRTVVPTHTMDKDKAWNVIQTFIRGNH